MELESSNSFDNIFDRIAEDIIDQKKLINLEIYRDATDLRTEYYSEEMKKLKPYTLALCFGAVSFFTNFFSIYYFLAIS